MTRCALLSILLLFEPMEIGEIRAYCPCEKCCGVWADGETATGKDAYLPGIASAVYPLGTVLFVPEYGLCVIDDIGPNAIEVRFPSHGQAVSWGVRYNVKIFRLRR